MPDFAASYAGRTAAIRWARDLLTTDPKTWCVLDTETTGLGPGTEVIALAIVDGYGTTLFDGRFRPTVAIEPGATAKHGRTAADLADAPPFTAYRDHLDRLVSGRRVVIYNAAYDLGVLAATCDRYGLAPLACRDIDCAMAAYAAFVGERSPQHDAFRRQPLPRATHGALGDCTAVLALLRDLAAAGDSVLTAPPQRSASRPPPLPHALAQLKDAIDAATANRPDVRTFVRRLAEAGYQVIPNAGGRNVAGMSFRAADGHTIKGSQLGNDYAGSRLVQRLDFNPAGDVPFLVGLARAARGRR